MDAEGEFAVDYGVVEGEGLDLLECGCGSAGGGVHAGAGVAPVHD